MRRSDLRWEAIFVDAYRQPYIPFYLTTREFFRLARERLVPGGLVVVNAGHPEGSTQLERVLAAGLRESFSYVARDPITNVNTLLVAADQPPQAERLRAAIPALDPRVRPIAEQMAKRLEPALEGGDVFTDDRAPVEWLIDRSIISYAAKG